MRAALLLVLLAAACGDDVTVEPSGTGAGTSSGTAAGTGSGTAAGTGSGTGSGTAAGTGSGTPGALDGEWLFSITPQQSPTKPAPYRVVADVQNGQLRMFLTPLNADDPAQIVGDAVEVGPFNIGDDPQFDISIPMLSAPGETNPLTDSELVVQPLDLTALSVSPFPCGDLGGNIVAPLMLPLTGTWAWTRYDGGGVPTPILNCNGDTPSF